MAEIKRQWAAAFATIIALYNAAEAWTAEESMSQIQYSAPPPSAPRDNFETEPELRLPPPAVAEVWTLVMMPFNHYQFDLPVRRPWFNAADDTNQGMPAVLRALTRQPAAVNSSWPG
jgi:hypothetical protein